MTPEELQLPAAFNVGAVFFFALTGAGKPARWMNQLKFVKTVVRR